MTAPFREPLDAEERALASRLARDPTAAPSPALDAAILAVARGAAPDGVPPSSAAAAAEPPAPTAPRHGPARTWPKGVGIAAAVLVAVGVTWQLRPMPDARPEAGPDMPLVVQARRADPASSPDQASTPAEAAGARARPERAAAAVVDARADDPVASPTPPAHTRSATRRALPASATSPEPSAPPLPSIAAVPPPTPELEAAPPVARRAIMAAPQSATSAQDAPASARAASGPAQARVLDTIDDVPEDEQPPASVDAPEVRHAWLERVRELLDAGEISAARDSLDEFHRRHPDAELPPDLRALLD